jgi:hypothetical protein
MNSDSRNSFAKTQARHVRQCWKEAKIVGCVWLTALVYCSTVLTQMGYVPSDQRPESPALVWGIPSWVFWGLFAPWIVMIVVTWGFAAFLLKDDEPYMDFPDTAKRDP